MFNVARRPLPLSDQLSIYWWRLIIIVTRRLNLVIVRAKPLVIPMAPFLWLPLLALVFGLFIGWIIALA